MGSYTGEPVHIVLYCVTLCYTVLGIIVRFSIWGVTLARLYTQHCTVLHCVTHHCQTQHMGSCTGKTVHIALCDTVLHCVRHHCQTQHMGSCTGETVHIALHYVTPFSISVTLLTCDPLV